MDYDRKPEHVGLIWNKNKSQQEIFNNAVQLQWFI